MRYALIVNPAAGNGFAVQTAEKLKAVMDEKRIEYEIRMTEGPGHGSEIAAELARDPKVRAVIAVGGDGTVSEVASGMIHTGKPMGIIPAGTGNDFIKTVRIPKDPLQAFSFIMDRPAKAVDTATINGDFFLNVSGTGFDVQVLECAAEKKKKYRGLTPYLLGLLQAISGFVPVNVQLNYDGTDADGEYLICAIANGRYIGGGIPICPVADVEDGKLNLVLVRSVPRWKIPFYLPGLMMSRILRFGITKHVKVSRVKISGKGLKFNIDGEIRPMKEAVFEIIPKSLELIC